MDNIETMNLGGDVEGVTEINKEKNIPKQQSMDSTPINDVMGAPADWETASQITPTVMPQYVQSPQQAPASQPVKSNPLNLTDEQMEALLVGVVAVIATSKPIQEKLSGVIPQMSEPGSVTSMAVTALVAAIVFYFGKRFVMPQ